MSDLLTRLQTYLADKYAIECELGRGGMATVFLARDRRLDRNVAVKVLHQDLSQALGAERFRREIDIATRLSHPHILPLYDSGEADGLLFYVMPYVTGESLRAKLKREQQLGVEETIKITCEVASALDYAHRQGVVHRDIKPENILLEDGHAVVADFGIARAISASQDSKLTQTGVTLGTPMYMSPEQACAEPDIDGRSDQYSLAAVAYEMLAGQPPFVGPTAQAIIARQMLDQVPSLTVVRRTIPLELEDAVLRALSKVKADRFPTVGQFAEALLNPGSTHSWRTVTRGTTAQRRPWSPAKRRAVFAAWTLTFVGGGAGLGWAGWKFVLHPTRAAAAPAVAINGLDPRHVAVLYFSDDSKSKSLGFLADGLTESLIDQLGQVHSLEVLSPNGAAQLRGADLSRDRTRDSIAHALRVGTLVRGSVEEEAGNYRVTVRLVDAVSGAEYQRGSFAQPKGSLLAMRDSLAGTVARFLRERLGEEVALRAARTGTSNADAWALAQRAERLRKDAAALAADDSGEAASHALAQADSMLARAESLDGAWAMPAAMRAEIAKAEFRLAGDPARGAPLLEQGLAHAERALSIDARNAAALEARGTLRYMRYLFHLEPDPRAARELLASAESDLKASTALDASRAGAWNTLSHLYAQIPNFTDAKLAAQRAYESDAYLSFAPDVLWRLYASSYELEQFTDASHWCDEGGRRFPVDPRFVRCQLWLQATKARTPDVGRAWQLAARLDQLTPAPSRPYQSREAGMAVAAVLARAGQSDSARRVLERSRGDAEVDPTGELMQTEAYVRGMLGSPADKDEAFRLLKRYLTANPEHRKGYAEDNAWRWRALRDDPRYREIVGAPQS